MSIENLLAYESNIETATKTILTSLSGAPTYTPYMDSDQDDMVVPRIEINFELMEGQDPPVKKRRDSSEMEYMEFMGTLSIKVITDASTSSTSSTANRNIVKAIRKALLRNSDNYTTGLGTSANVIPNFDFSSGLASWSKTDNDSTITHESGDFVTIDTGAGTVGNIKVNSLLNLSDAGMVAGNSYEFKVDMKRNSGSSDTLGKFKINFYDSSNSLVSFFENTPTPITPSSHFQTYKFVVDIPSTAVKFKPVAAGVENHSISFDNFTYTRPTVLHYYDVNQLRPTSTISEIDGDFYVTLLTYELGFCVRDYAWPNS